EHPVGQPRLLLQEGRLAALRRLAVGADRPRAAPVRPERSVRYVSLFSGIEAATLAWRPLGWELVAVAEVEPFACAVIAHHHPGVPNLGDVERISDQQLRDLGPVDLVVGGFPCQDVSVAGRRAGLEGTDGRRTRSGLFFAAMDVVRRLGPRWLVVENVP